MSFLLEALLALTFFFSFGAAIGFLLGYEAIADRLAEQAYSAETPKYVARVKWRVADLFYALGYWGSLPWRCALFGHGKPVTREHYNPDLGVVEGAWLECPRPGCGYFFGWAPNDPVHRQLQEKR